MSDSIWKKEISFSRKPKEPKSAPAPKPGGERWYAKEISLTRKPKAAPEPAEWIEPQPLAAVPWWKKELTLSRKEKTPKQPKQAKAPKAAKQPKQRRVRRGARIVGLTIGSSQLAAARIANDGVAELEQVARAPLAPGVVVGGELREPEALAQALRSFFAVNKLPTRNVRLGIASPRIGVRIFELAGIGDERQLKNAVQFRAQEALPIPLDEAVVDFRVLGESLDDAGQVVKRVLLVVAHRELVDRYVTACRKAGLTLTGIDLEAFALLRSLAPPADRDGSALVAVALGHERTTLAVSDGRICEFTRVLEWGGWTVNVALARVLDSTPAEVEAVKRMLTLAGAPFPEGLAPERAAAAVDAVRRSVEALARELVSSLQFYQGQPGSLGIGEIVITGGTAQLGGLAEELERLVGVPVRLGNPLGRLKVADGVEDVEVGALAVAIGLGIDD